MGIYVDIYIGIDIHINIYLHGVCMHVSMWVIERVRTGYDEREEEESLPISPFERHCRCMYTSRLSHRESFHVNSLSTSYLSFCSSLLLHRYTDYTSI